FSGHAAAWTAQVSAPAARAQHTSLMKSNARHMSDLPWTVSLAAYTSVPSPSAFSHHPACFAGTPPRTEGRVLLRSALPPSSLILPPSSFLLHPSSFILPPSSFILHPSSFILHGLHPRRHRNLARTDDRDGVRPEE